MIERDRRALFLLLKVIAADLEHLIHEDGSGELLIRVLGYVMHVQVLQVVVEEIPSCSQSYLLVVRVDDQGAPGTFRRPERESLYAKQTEPAHWQSRRCA